MGQLGQLLDGLLLLVGVAAEVGDDAPELGAVGVIGQVDLNHACASVVLGWSWVVGGSSMRMTFSLSVQ